MGTSVALRVLPTAADDSVIQQLCAARAELPSASLDALIAVRAWCQAVADAAKQKALAELALEAGETRARAEFRLGKLLRGGAGAGLSIKGANELRQLGELTDDQFEATLADMRSTRRGDQILTFTAYTVMKRAVKLFSEEIEPGIRRDFRGLYNGRSTIQEARADIRYHAQRKAEFARFTTLWNDRRVRSKPENVRIDEAYTRARRLAQSAEHLKDNTGSVEARGLLGRAETLLGEVAQLMYEALQAVVLEDAE